jgi:hypothetical protein
VANLLLGSVTLDDVRQRRLRYSQRRLKRLERVDFARGKGGLGGAAVWFQCITHSVAQNVARLVLEYNRACIPLAELPAASEEDRARFQRWLQEREGRADALARGEAVLPVEEPLSVDDEIDDARATAFRSAEFHALHFVADDPRRDAAIERRFGKVVLRHLEEDRANLMRVVFGTYPMRELPRERRTFNPYEAYRRNLAHGRMYLFPLRLLWLALGLLRRMLRLLVSLVREVLDPVARAAPKASGHASFAVARRKIHRMRRPVAIEALRLRAEFDPEYLGLALPGGKPGVGKGDRFGEDLRRLEASEREWEEFRRLKSKRRLQLATLARALRLLERRGKDLRDATNREGIRAVALAWICDHRGILSRVAAFERLRELLHRVEVAPPRRDRRFGVPRIGASRVRDRVDRLWPSLAQGGGENADAALRRRFADAIVHGMAGHAPVALRRDVDVLLEHAAETADDVYQHAYGVMREVAARPSEYGEALIAVRTVQTLAMLDVASYERLVHRLGRYTALARKPRPLREPAADV